MKYIVIFVGNELDALLMLSDQEVRTPEEQIRYIVRQALFAHGALRPEDVQKQPEPEAVAQVVTKVDKPSKVYLPQRVYAGRVSLRWQLFERVATDSPVLMSDLVAEFRDQHDPRVIKAEVLELVKRGAFLVVEKSKKDLLVGISGEARAEYERRLVDEPG